MQIVGSVILVNYKGIHFLLLNLNPKKDLLDISNGFSGQPPVE